MSWSITYAGKAGKCAEATPKRFEAMSYLTGVESTIKDKAGSLIAETLAAMSPDTLVKVDASGSQSINGTKSTQSLKIEISPLWAEYVE